MSALPPRLTRPQIVSTVAWSTVEAVPQGDPRIDGDEGLLRILTHKDKSWAWWPDRSLAPIFAKGQGKSQAEIDAELVEKYPAARQRLEECWFEIATPTGAIQ